MDKRSDHSNKGGDWPDPQKWLDYLEGKLPENERRALEEEIAGSDFLKEALEGLTPPDSGVDLNRIVGQLNQQLRQKLVVKRKRRTSKDVTPQTWAWVAVVLVLTICLIGYFLYERLRH
jgi:hypothetical protein